MVSSTVGASTTIGWKRRSSAASFSMYLRYSSSVVAPMQCSSPRASIGLSSCRRRSSPRCAGADDVVDLVDEQQDAAVALLDLVQYGLEPLLELAAVLGAGEQRAEVEREDRARSLSHSGTSPRTMRWASPSAIAVLPTPGSPMSTGLFFVLRDRMRMTRRISASRPMIGSSLPAACLVDQVDTVLVERLIGDLGRIGGDALVAAHLAQGVEQAGSASTPNSASRRPAGVAPFGDQGEQQMLDRDELVLELLGLVGGDGQQRLQAAA